MLIIQAKKKYMEKTGLKFKHNNWQENIRNVF